MRVLWIVAHVVRLILKGVAGVVKNMAGQMPASKRKMNRKQNGQLKKSDRWGNGRLALKTVQILRIVDHVVRLILQSVAGVVKNMAGQMPTCKGQMDRKQSGSLKNLISGVMPIGIKGCADFVCC